MAYTAFGKAVKKRLIDMDKNQEWLYERVREKTGLYFDSSYLHKIMSGAYTPEKMVTAIREILDIPMVAEAQTEKQDGRGGSHGST